MRQRRLKARLPQRSILQPRRQPTMALARAVGLVLGRAVGLVLVRALGLALALAWAQA